MNIECKACRTQNNVTNIPAGRLIVCGSCKNTLHSVVTHYDVLKVSRHAPDEVISAAFRSLAKKHHPDLNGGNAEATRILQSLNDSYSILKDPFAKAKHDSWIVSVEEKYSGAPEKAPAPPPRPPPVPSRADQATNQPPPIPTYPGLNRLQFTLWFFGIIIVGAFINTSSQSDDSGFLLGSIFLIPVTVLRFRNMGTSGWWSLLSLIPLVSLVVYIFCFTQRPGRYT